MPFKAIKDKDFFIKDNRIILNKDFFEKRKKDFKKITGTRLASILGLNKYSSPVKTWAIMTNLYFEEMDEMFSKAGQIIEPKIKDYVEKKVNKKYLQYNPFSIKWDVFKENKIFGGIPDGEPLDNKTGLISYIDDNRMLEIKTTSIDAFEYKFIDGALRVQKDSKNIPLVKTPNAKKESWYDKNNKVIIPMEYQLQLSLYLYLRNITKGVFAIGFLEKEDYANPLNFKCNENNIELVNIDIDLNEFKKIIDQAENWYLSYMEKGISPLLTNDDIKWLKDNGISI